MTYKINRNYESERIMLVGRVVEAMQNEIENRKQSGMPVQSDFIDKFYRRSERLYELCHELNYMFKFVENVYNKAQEDIKQKFISKEEISDRQMETYFRVKDSYNSLKKQRDALAKWIKETHNPRNPRTPVKHEGLASRLVA